MKSERGKRSKWLLWLMVGVVLWPAMAIEYHEGDSAVWVKTGDNFVMDHGLVVTVGTILSSQVSFIVGSANYALEIDQVLSRSFYGINETRWIHFWLTEIHNKEARIRLTSDVNGFEIANTS